jgi:hypothetical protein
MKDCEMMGQMPNKLTRYLLIVSGIIGLFVFFINIFLAYWHFPDEPIDYVAVNKAGIFLIGSAIYLITCIAIIQFRFLKKYCVKRTILWLMCIHLSGIALFFIFYRDLYLVPATIICAAPWLVPIILDLVVIILNIFHKQDIKPANNKTSHQ